MTSLSACNLSPFGQHTTRSGCESGSVCGAKWRCAKGATTVDGVLGEVDAFGEFVPVGSALRALDGVFESADSVLCYTCDATGAGCVATTDGSNGQHATAACGTGCLYVCGEDGGKLLHVAGVHGAGTGSASPNCWTCNGSMESGERCVPSGFLQEGEYSSEAECLDLSVDGCGWGYGVNPSTNLCELREDAPRGRSLDECRVSNPAQSSWGWGCFDAFARRYGVCVGIPGSGVDGPKVGETVFSSLDACNASPGGVGDVAGSAQRPSCPPEVSLSEDNSACLCPANASGLECQNACDPLPGTWQLWRVGASNINNAYSGFDIFPGRWSATLEPHAHITWNAPSVQVFTLPAFRHADDDRTMYGAYLSDTAWRALPRLWYTSVEQYLDREENGGTPLFPHMAVGFRRVDPTTVEVVLVSATYSNLIYNPGVSDPISPIPGGRRQGVAVLHVHAPSTDCFVMPALDYEAEHHTAAGIDMIPMRFAPLTPYSADVKPAEACFHGRLVGGVCECEGASGDYCQFTPAYSCDQPSLDVYRRTACGAQYACDPATSTCSVTNAEECAYRSCFPDIGSCIANSACTSDACENPLSGSWTLVGGENRDIQVFDGDQTFQFVLETLENGVMVYKSTANAFGSTPLMVVNFRDGIDEDANRVISFWASARIYSDNYQDFPEGDSQRTVLLSMEGGDVVGDFTSSPQFTLASFPPNAPGYRECFQLDEIDFNALCETALEGWSCMSPDMPLFLQRVG